MITSEGVDCQTEAPLFHFVPPLTGGLSKRSFAWDDHWGTHQHKDILYMVPGGEALLLRSPDPGPFTP